MRRRSDKREFLMQAHKLEVGKRNKFKQLVTGWCISEKLDGQQAFWDGGLTRGMPAHLVPWANTEKDPRDLVSTGLWSRYGKSIQASSDWLDYLPNHFLVGELYLGRNRFQETMSITRTTVAPHPKWMEVTFRAYDMPSIEEFTSYGRIKVRDWEVIVEDDWRSWIKNRRLVAPIFDSGPVPLEHALATIQSNKVVVPVVQRFLPFGTAKSEEAVMDFFEEVIGLGGEGVVLRDPSAIWTPYRSHDYLKLKATDDCEVTVVGCTTGERGKEDRLWGLMGSLIVTDGEREFSVGGFNLSERKLTSIAFGDCVTWAKENPGKRCPSTIWAESFPVGTEITIKFFARFADGTPREPKYFRKFHK